MKTLQTLIFSMMLLGGLSLSTCSKANAASSPESAKIKAISTEIRGKVNFPVELSDKTVNEKVVVEFKIKSDKTLEVVSIETQNDFLKTYVKEQISGINLENYSGFEGKTLQISLYFAN
jgi:hypothetical protein